MRVTVIIIGTDAADAARTSASLEGSEQLADARVLTRAPDDPSPWSDVTEGAVILVRAGDRLLAAGALLDGLADADVALGGHRIAGRGHWGIDLAAPTIAGVEQLADWAVAPPFELSTFAVRRHCLPTAVHPAPGQPGGAVAVLHAALSASGRPAASVDSTVADVRIRPEHSGDPAAVLRVLHGVLVGPLCREPDVASAVRRRALSLAYLEAGRPVSSQFDADSWWGPALAGADRDAALAVVRDLQWALTCLADTHRIRVDGLDGLARQEVSDMTAATAPDLSTAAATLQALHLHVGELTDTIRWLHQEVRHRDEQIAAHVPGVRVDELRATELGRVFARRVVRGLRRRLQRGRP